MAGNYPDLIAPLIPDAQKNKSPELLIEGFTKGMAAFAQFAQMRRQSESDLAHMALQERLASEQHDLEQQKINMTAEMIPYAKRLSNAQAKSYLLRAESASSGAAGMVEQDMQRFNYVNNFKSRATALGLNDPNLENEPGKFYLNYRILQKQYQTSTIPEVKNALKAYEDQAQQHQIPLPELDNMQQPIAGKPPMVPAGQIIEWLHDPLSRDRTRARLIAGGYIKPGKAAGGFWSGYSKATEDEPSDMTKGLIEKSKNPDYFTPAPVMDEPYLKGNARDFKNGGTLEPNSLQPDASGQSLGTTSSNKQYPIHVQTVDEARKYPSGTWIQTPDGRVGQLP